MPSDSEIDELREALTELLSTPEDLFQQYRELDDNDAQTKVAHARISKDRSTSPKFLLLHLPIEIVYRILKLACDAESPFVTGALDSNVTRGVAAEVTISQVCCLWRKMSLTTPYMWSSFSIQLSDTIKTPQSRLLKYFERSQEKPLDLWFTLAAQDDINSLMSFVEKAKEHGSRWRRLTLFMDGALPTDDIILSLFSAKAPLLESIEIQTNLSWNSQSRLSFKESVKGTFPSLTHLRTDARVLENFFSSQLSNLTTLQIKYSPYRMLHWPFLLNILRSPTLTSLSVEGSVFSEAFSSPNPVTARNLKHLRCSDPNLANGMFREIEFPNLEVLVFRGLLLPQMTFSYDIDAFSQGDITPTDLMPSLRTLVLIDCNVRNFTPTCPDYLAYATKSVTDLIIVNPVNDQSSNVFEFLLQNPQKTLLWPCLETITYKGDTPDNDGVACFTKLLDSRSKVNRPCKLRLTEEDAKWFEEDTPDLWKDFINQGFFEPIPQHLSLVPWPPRESGHFSMLSDLFFDPRP